MFLIAEKLLVGKGITSRS